MFKKIIYSALITFIFELNASATAAASPAASSAPVSLNAATGQYMELMLGSRGINDAKGTEVQLRQMIDGAITAGITDRLYKEDARLNTFQHHVRNLAGKKKLHVQLAYAFYCIGYYEPIDIGALKGKSLVLCGALEPNFDGEFAKLCVLMHSSKTIYQYKDSLEDVIKRTSQPLRFEQFAASTTPGVIFPPTVVQTDTTSPVGAYGEIVRIQSIFSQLISQMPIAAVIGSAPEVSYIGGLKGLPPTNAGDNESRYIQAVLNNVAKVGSEHAADTITVPKGLNMRLMGMFLNTDFSPLRVYNQYVPTGHSVLGIAAQETVDLKVNAPLAPPLAPGFSLSSIPTAPLPTSSSASSSASALPASGSVPNIMSVLGGLSSAKLKTPATQVKVETPDARTSLLGAIKGKPKLKKIPEKQIGSSSAAASSDTGIFGAIRKGVALKAVPKQIGSNKAPAAPAGMGGALMLALANQRGAVIGRGNNNDDDDSDSDDEWEDSASVYVSKPSKAASSSATSIGLSVTPAPVSIVPAASSSPSVAAGSTGALSSSVATITPSPVPFSSPAPSASPAPSSSLSTAVGSTGALSSSVATITPSPAPSASAAANGIPDEDTWAELEFQRERQAINNKISALDEEDVNALRPNMRMARRHEIERLRLPLTLALARYDSGLGKSLIIRELKKRYPALK